MGEQKQYGTCGVCSLTNSCLRYDDDDDPQCAAMRELSQIPDSPYYAKDTMNAKAKKLVKVYLSVTRIIEVEVPTFGKSEYDIDEAAADKAEEIYKDFPEIRNLRENDWDVELEEIENED